MMKILVVDDEQDIKDLFEQKFRKEIKSKELEFVFTFNANDALAYLDSQNSEVVLILSDINMPGMSGLELLKEIKIKSFDPNPKIFMITAYGDEQSHRESLDLGASDFLTKPVNFIELKEKFKSILL
jgi:two-component system, chemotaxis family, chemotaxis protein CheY